MGRDAGRISALFQTAHYERINSTLFGPFQPNSTGASMEIRWLSVQPTNESRNLGILHDGLQSAEFCELSIGEALVYLAVADRVK